VPAIGLAKTNGGHASLCPPYALYALGLFIGAWLFGVADESIFRRICYALIVIAVVISLPVLDGVIR
jgi:biotin transporter BioY